MPSYEFERTQRIAILGGGPGGYEAALAGAQLGAEVTLVERAGVGGSAVLTDVVPSKTLIATAEAANAAGEAADLGVQFFTRNGDGRAVRPEVAVNLGAVNQRLLMLARQQSEDMKSQLIKAGVRILAGDGRLDGPNRLVVSTGKGKSRTDFDEIDADTLVVAVGARPRQLDSAKPDGERIFTWTQLYTLDEVPEHMIVVGSGVTGAEFASAYLALGSKVSLVSSREQVLPGEDADAARVIENVFTRNGMDVLSKSRADKVERTADGVLVTLSDGRTVEGSHCLMAVGSIPNTAGIGLEEAGVQLTSSGHIRVNRVARTSMPSIYAAGDCSDFLPLASVASMQGRTAVYHAMGDAVAPTELRNVSSNIFTQPEVATVGWSQKHAAGERYILGGENLSLKQVLDMLAGASGRPAPSVRLPHAVALAAGYVDAAFSRLLSREPRIPLEGVRMARHSMFVDASKARRELGFAPSMVSAALGRAVEWYRKNGYVGAGRVAGAAQAHAV